MVSYSKSSFIFDLMAIVYFCLASVAFILVGTRYHAAPIIMGHPYFLAFMKFACLATFGESLRRRIATKSWALPHMVQRFVTWGFWGIWIAFAFQLASIGVQHVTGRDHGFLYALVVSLWLNILSGYGFFMMLSHFVADKMIDGQWMMPWQYLGIATLTRWARVVLLCLVFFWLPAHTLTFMLPPTWRVVFAAYLSIFLGALLSLGEQKGRPIDTVSPS